MRPPGWLPSSLVPPRTTSGKRPWARAATPPSREASNQSPLSRRLAAAVKIASVPAVGGNASLQAGCSANRRWRRSDRRRSRTRAGSRAAMPLRGGILASVAPAGEEVNRFPVGGKCRLVARVGEGRVGMDGPPEDGRAGLEDAADARLVNHLRRTVADQVVADDSTGIVVDHDLRKTFGLIDRYGLPNRSEREATGA